MGRINSKCVERIGETRLMSSGLEGTIIGYISNKDVDVRMSDGRIVRGCTYCNFRRGLVSGKGYGSGAEVTRKTSRIGEKRMMRCGLEAEIVAYRSHKDMDVMLSDGRLLTGCAYCNFQSGRIGTRLS